MARPPLDGTVLVTGASSGIGAAIARQLAGEAATLILVARRAERLEALAAELRGAWGRQVLVEPCDLSDPAAVDALIERIDARGLEIDILVNNAGMGDLGSFSTASWETSQRMIAVNCAAVAQLCHRVLPGMVARNRGGILQISSGFGLTVTPGAAMYAATKHFVSALSEGLVMELQGTDVVVTQVCPGPVKTEFEAGASRLEGTPSPGPVEISAESCARQGIAAFRAGRARVVPGWIMAAVIYAGVLTPNWLLRLLYRPLLGQLRKRSLPTT